MNHVMVDIETMGVRPTSAIVSIGAVRFDIDSDFIDTDNAFYRVVDLDSCLRLGMTVDASTVEWWLAQGEAARGALAVNKVHVDIAVGTFDYWLCHFPQVQPLRVWCNGPSFDGVVLENAHTVCERRVPWRYNELRDMRTIVELANLDLSTLPRVGNAHNALDDAVFQAKAVQVAYRYLMDE